MSKTEYRLQRLEEFVEEHERRLDAQKRDMERLSDALPKDNFDRAARIDVLEGLLDYANAQVAGCKEQLRQADNEAALLHKQLAAVKEHFSTELLNAAFAVAAPQWTRITGDPNDSPPENSGWVLSFNGSGCALTPTSTIRNYPEMFTHWMRIPLPDEPITGRVAPNKPFPPDEGELLSLPLEYP